MKLPFGRLAVIGLSAALVLAGCSDGDSSPSATPAASTSSAASSASASEAATATPEDIAAVGAVKVTQAKAGEEPVLTFTSPLAVTGPVARLITPGTGAVLEEGQSLSFNTVAFKGSDGTKSGTTYGDTEQKITLSASSIYQELFDALKGQKIGSLVLFASPTQDTDGTAITMLTTLEITAAKTPDPVLARAEGETVKPAAGLPTVKLGSDGKPTITVPSGYKAPTELVVQPLIKGTGAEVTATDTITAHYTGILLDGTQFDSSWDRGTPASFSLQEVIAGWTQGLAGQTVGSQVLLVIPSDLGYGTTAQDSIPANSTLVFVVDILGIS